MIWMISVFDFSFGAECEECSVFQGKLAFLWVKWTECVKFCQFSTMNLVQNMHNIGWYHFLTITLAQNLQNVEFFKENVYFDNWYGQNVQNVGLYQFLKITFGAEYAECRIFKENLPF